MTNFEIPLMFQSPYLHFTAVVVGYLLLVLIFWCSRMKRMFGQLRRKWKPPSPFDPRLLQHYKNAVYVWSVFLLLGLFLFFLSIYLTGYEYVGKKVELSGQMTRRGSQVEFVSSTGVQLSAQVRGNQIAAAGVFLKFPSWMKYIGLETYHRLITFRGNQETEFHYGEKPDAEWLKQYMSDRVFLLLYKYRDWPLLVEPSYTESVYFSGARNKVLVTREGYIIQ